MQIRGHSCRKRISDGCISGLNFKTGITLCSLNRSVIVRDISSTLCAAWTSLWSVSTWRFKGSKSHMAGILQNKKNINRPKKSFYTLWLMFKTPVTFRCTLITVWCLMTATYIRKGCTSTGQHDFKYCRSSSEMSGSSSSNLLGLRVCNKEAVVWIIIQRKQNYTP